MKKQWLSALSVMILLAFITNSSCKTEKHKKIVWRWNLNGRSYGQPQIQDETVFVSSDSGEILAGRISSGTKIWERKFDHPVLAGPGLVDKHVIAASENGEVRLFDSSSGETLWKKTVDDDIIAPLSCNDKICVAPSKNGTLYGIERSSGNLFWNVPGNIRYTGAPLFYGPYIYIGGWKGLFLSLKQDGTVNWQLSLQENIVDAAIAHRNVIYFATRFRNVYAVDATSGKVRWRIAVKNSSNLQVFNGKLLAATENRLKIIDPNTGKIHQELPIKYNIDRIYADEKSCYLICGKRILRLSPQFISEDFFLHINSIFKVAAGSKHLVFSDDLNLIAAIEK